MRLWIGPQLTVLTTEQDYLFNFIAPAMLVVEKKRNASLLGANAGDQEEDLISRQ